MPNLAFLLELSARRAPADTAIVYSGERFSYRALNCAANGVARALAADGVGPGDKVALLCHNRPDFVAAYFGILKAGAVVVPLNVHLKRAELADQLTRSGARAILCGMSGDAATTARQAQGAVSTCERFWRLPSARSDPDGEYRLCLNWQGDAVDVAAADRDWHDAAVVVFTSGTSGRPKAVEISQGALHFMAMLNQGMADRSMSRIRVVVLPMFHLFGQVTAIALGIFSGETLVIAERFEPEAVLRLMRDERVNHIAAVPAMYRALLDCPALDDATRRGVQSSLRLAASGGAPMPDSLSDAFQAAFGVPILDGYGLTETASVVTWTLPGEQSRIGSVGRAVPGVAVKILDEAGHVAAPGAPGRIFVRSGGMMTGYLDEPALTNAVLRDGWLDTGDIGRLDEDGFLYLLGRVDDLILRGATKVYPAEIVPVLERHPAVERAVVLGVPDPAVGQEVKAIVAPRPGSSVTADELAAWVRQLIAEDKYPRIIEVRADLPIGATGKNPKDERSD